MRCGTRHSLARRAQPGLLGPGRGEAALAAYFTKQIAKGPLRKDDTLQMAQHFMSLITGGSIRWFVFGFTAAPVRKDELQKHLRSAIQIFLRAYGATVIKGK